MIPPGIGTMNWDVLDKVAIIVGIPAGIVSIAVALVAFGRYMMRRGEDRVKSTESILDKAVRRSNADSSAAEHQPIVIRRKMGILSYLFSFLAASILIVAVVASIHDSVKKGTMTFERTFEPLIIVMIAWSSPFGFGAFLFYGIIPGLFLEHLRRCCQIGSCYFSIDFFLKPEQVPDAMRKKLFYMLNLPENTVFQYLSLVSRNGHTISKLRLITNSWNIGEKVLKHEYTLQETEEIVDAIIEHIREKTRLT